MKNKSVLIVKLVLLLILLAAVIACCVYVFTNGLSVIHFNSNGFNINLFDGEVRGEMLTEQKSFSGIEEIDASLASYNLTVNEYDGKSVKVEFSGSDNEKYFPTFVQNGTRLNLYQPSVVFSGISGEITISVPKDSKLDYTVDTASGETIINADSGEVDIDSASGEIELNGSGSSLKIDAVSGAVEINGAFTTENIDSVSGKIEAVADNSSRTLKFSTVSGAVTVGIMDGAGYKVDFESVSGTAYDEINGSEYRGDSSFSSDAGNIAIDIETISGDFTIE